MQKLYGYASVLAGALMLLPTAAEAQSKQAKLALRRAKYTRSYCVEDFRPKACVKWIKKAEQAMAKVPSAERSSAQMREAAQYLRKHKQKAMQALAQQSQKAAATANRRQLDAKFGGLRRAAKSTLKLLSLGESGANGGYLYFSQFNRSRLPLSVLRSRTKEHRDAINGPIAKLAAMCPVAASTVRYRVKLRDPAYVCKLAKKRKAYWEAYLSGAMNHAVASRIQAWKNAVSALGRTGRIATKNYEALSNHKNLLENASRDAKLIAQTLQRKIPASTTQQLSGVITSFKATVVARGKKKIWTGKAKRRDGRVKRALARNAKQRGLKLRRYGVLQAKWDIKRNGLGRPIERTKLTALLAQKRGEKHCRVYAVTAVEDYAGGGRYGATKVYTRGFDEFTISKCR